MAGQQMQQSRMQQSEMQPSGVHQPGMQQSGMQQPSMQQPGMQQSGMVPQLQSVDIGDVVQTDVVTVEPDTPTPTIAAKMAEEEVGAIVVEEEGDPIGVITDRNIALLLRETEDIADLTATDIMSDDLITGTTEMTIFDVLEQLNEANIRRLPIVDENGSLEGIVTLDDLLVLLGSEFQNAADIIQSQSSRI